MTPIAIIGSGPTALYALKVLLAAARLWPSRSSRRPAPQARVRPYRRQTNGSALLANIASIELPPLLETLEDC